MKHTIAFICIVLVSAFISIGATRKDDPPAKKHDPSRIDYLVRDDLFAGFGGDTAAFERAMKLCEDTLQLHPHHAEALVWHGAGTWFKSGTAFRSGDVANGMKLSQLGLGEMDEAVDLEPNNLGVRIPRGAALLASAKFVPGEFGKQLMQKGIGDYETVMKLEEGYLGKLSEHARGELFGGLAESYAFVGDSIKARAFLARIERDLPRTKYAAAAKDHLVNRESAKQLTCIGCHE